MQGMYHWYDFENRKRGSISFPVEFHHVTAVHPRYIMPYHWHSEIEIIRIIEGSMDILLDSKKYRLQKNDFLYVPPNTIHGGRPDDCVYQCIVCDIITLFQNNVFFSCYSDLFNNRDILALHTETHPEVFTALTRLFETTQKRADGWQIISMGCLFQFFGIVLEKHYFEETSPTTKRNKPNVDLFQKVFKLIRAKYNQPITLEDMANEAHMSPNYFSQVFKETTHWSPIEYLIHYRIEYSKYLLCVKNTSVAEAAMLSGFNNCAYYIKVFKKSVGITPYKYKKLHSDNKYLQAVTT